MHLTRIYDATDIVKTKDKGGTRDWCTFSFVFFFKIISEIRILGDPGADKAGEGKSKRAEKYGTKESKERREEPLGTMSYQTSSNGRRRSGF